MAKPKYGKEQNISFVKMGIEMLIEGLGGDLQQEGLKETPGRAAKAYIEMMEGMTLTNEQIAQRNNKCFEDVSGKDLVLEKNIHFYSFCEHHILPMELKCHIAYLPKGKVIGLSKMARIATLCGARLQLQERIGEDIAEVMQMILGTQDVAVIIDGTHGCMTMRGIRNITAETKSATLRGAFAEKSDLRAELYALIGK